MFETKQQLQEFTGYGEKTVEFLWNGLKSGVITDNDIIQGGNA